MKKLLLIAAGVFITLNGFGQSIAPEVISSAGSHDTGGSVKLDWTMGEMATTTLTGGSNSLTQGFHQPYFVITSIKVQEEPKFILKAFPNPTSSLLNIKTQLPANSGCEVRLINSIGEVLDKKIVSLQNENILMDLSPYPAGSYFIYILHPESEQDSIYKIQKIN